MSISAGFILFVFVGIFAYRVSPRKFKWITLLVLSSAFYIFIGKSCLFYILCSIAVTYISARAIEKHPKKSRAFLMLGTCINIILLLSVKLSPTNLILPLGISFYTFQALGYLIDVKRGKTHAEKNPFKLALFVAYFPQLIQGPISRHGDLVHQLYEPQRADIKYVYAGILRISWGFFKKLVIADNVGIAVKSILGRDLGGGYVFLLIIIYSLQIYADFTGGMDIAIGFSEAIGIKLKENFNRPFASTSVKEYWRRWHITLGEWFSDYVFYPLSVSRPMQRLSKLGRKKLGTNIGKRIPVYISLLVTWFLTGFWHGAEWNFITWGLLNGAIILISQELSPIYKKLHTGFPSLKSPQARELFCRARTFFIIGSLRILDLYRSVPETFKKFFGMLDISSWRSMISGGIFELGLNLYEWLMLLLCVALLLLVSLYRTPLRYKLSERSGTAFAALGAIWCAIAIFGAYGVGFDVSGFIYNQF